jgi:BMFP domain-containing protein YqiC
VYLASGMSVLGLSAHGASCALAESSQPAVVSHEQMVIAEMASAATSPEALLATDRDIVTSKTISATSSAIAPVAPATIPQEQTVPTTASQLPEQMSPAANPDALAPTDPTVATWKTIPATPTAIAQTIPDTTLEEETSSTDTSMQQVTSVTQLADVQPTDWAFQALQLLVERYGCIAGYPDRTYRGNRAMTRYEFAAGLNACLDQVNKLIATATADLVKREDLETLQRLQTEFSVELASLRGRVDALEAKTAELEATRFSTTTKLTGQVVWAVSAGGFSGDRIVNPIGREIANENPNTTSLHRASLDLNTSFTGSDLLKIRLNTGSSGPTNNPAGDNPAGFLEPTFGSVLEFTLAGRENRFSIARLHYNFTPLTDVTVLVGTVIASFDFVDRNRYANLSFRDFSTQALVNNYILLPVPVGTGALIDWHPGKGPFKLRALYLAADAANPNPENQRFIGPLSPFTRLLYPSGGGSRGLFGAPYQGTVELEYSPSKAFAVRLQYSGGKVFEERFDVFGLNFEWELSPQIGVFGRYGYGSYDDTAFGDINPNYWMAGIAFPDLFVPRALAGIAAGQPFINSAVGNATQTNLEAFYNLPITNNIRITPLVQVILNPANQNSNGTIVTGTLRTVLSF